MIKRLGLTVAAVMLAASSEAGSIKAYCVNRLRDLSQCLWVDVGAINHSDVSCSVGLKLTDALTQHWEYSRGKRVGLIRNMGTVWEEEQLGIPFLMGGRGANPDKEYPADLKNRLNSFVGPGFPIDRQPNWLRESFGYERRPFVEMANVEAGITYGLTVRTGVSPGQAADFVLGIVGLDPAKDDKH
ncbi:hypothetical protein HN592_03875 [Candidatus Woesearchaeota archaeon]|jgi:hypothetical protein|nr:hypothetical protein [Candidatus Woesearchaeota archaeon]MBT4368352.1 hypothetical protein [Candidatus Woesearchaeota archaeon]MBT4712841.1 hypothetical protein [Candidatus Woesearchaeota archaeon]MBT6639753.1 hypothetical protein [Candidatus Woesearchaeota archaeon]MBT7133925.1 hypothetical protein [Candidatus Woesearchaeota archaeon]